MFFYNFIDKLFFAQVAEQTIYFPLFAGQPFFSQKTIALQQESNGQPLKLTNHNVDFPSPVILVPDYVKPRLKVWKHFFVLE